MTASAFGTSRTPPSGGVINTSTLAPRCRRGVHMVNCEQKKLLLFGPRLDDPIRTIQDGVGVAATLPPIHATRRQRRVHRINTQRDALTGIV
jgi:hypothetical protein